MLEINRTEIETILAESEVSEPMFDEDFWEEAFERANDFWSDPDRCPF